MQRATLRTELRGDVFVITLTRAAEYNTITPTLRDELGQAIDEGDASAGRVLLLRAEGRAFCAGHSLDEGTRAQRAERRPGEGPESGAAVAVERARVWDSVADMRMIGRYADVFEKLWYARKPTVAAVQGWCIGGGTDLVLNADLIVAAESAVFGYPPSRVWGIPLTPQWVFRLGLERAKRYLLTGDAIPAREAERLGLILEVHPDAELEARSFALAERIARVPTTQLVMLKLFCNQMVENMGFQSSRHLGTLFDGIARHTQEGIDFVDRANEVGFRQAVRERDDPFGDYGSRKKEDER